MVDEIFRTYLIILLHEPDNTKRKILSKDIIEVSNRYLTRLESDSQGTIFWNKMRFLNVIAGQYVSGMNQEIIYDRMFAHEGKFTSLKDEVDGIKNLEITTLDLEHLEKQLIYEKQYLASEDYLKKFKAYVEKIENREFEGVEDIETELHHIIEELYMSFVRETNLSQSLDGVKTIDYSDPDSLLDRMNNFYDGNNYISTGYKNLDRLMNGGLEKTRLYLLAGKPGSGKSTFMLNIMHNMSKEILKAYEEGKNEGKSDEYILYITLENLALESNQRLLCKKLGITMGDLESILRTGDINKVVRDSIIEFKHSNIIIAYFPPRSFSTIDLFSYVENLNNIRKSKPKAVFVDYLDLMKLPTYISEMRLQLGDITLGLKTLAVLHKIPVISATQLLKGAYGNRPTLGDIKESSEKIDHSDAIGLINRLDAGDDYESFIAQTGYNVEINWDKNRATGNGCVRFAMRLNKFLIEEEIDLYNSRNNKNNQSNIPSPNNGAPTPPKPKLSFAPPTKTAYIPPSQINDGEEGLLANFSQELENISI